MALRPDHQDCTTCWSCGLPWCPDCDDEGLACACPADVIVEQEMRAAERRRRRQQGANVVEYALLTFVIALLVATVAALEGAVWSDVRLNAPAVAPSGQPTLTPPNGD